MKDQKLSDEDIAILKQAKQAQDTMGSMGMNEPDSQPVVEEEKVYENFIEISDLPSKGTHYKNKIVGQPLKVNDLLQIQSMDEFNIHDRIDEIFRRRIRGIDPGEILLGDELCIALWLREASFPQFKFPLEGYDCVNPKCKKYVDASMAQFGFEDISYESNIEEVNAKFDGKEFVEFELPHSKKIVKLVQKKRKHVTQARKVIQENYYDKKIPVPDGVEETLEIISILDLGKESLLETMQEVAQLEALDFIEILKQVNNHVFASDIVINRTCPACKEGTSLKGYPFRPALYFPIDIQ